MTNELLEIENTLCVTLAFLVESSNAIGVFILKTPSSLTQFDFTLVLRSKVSTALEAPATEYSTGSTLFENSHTISSGFEQKARNPPPQYVSMSTGNHVFP